MSADDRIRPGDRLKMHIPGSHSSEALLGWAWGQVWCPRQTRSVNAVASQAYRTVPRGHCSFLQALAWDRKWDIIAPPLRTGAHVPRQTQGSGTGSRGRARLERSQMFTVTQTDAEP